MPSTPKSKNTRSALGKQQQIARPPRRAHIKSSKRRKLILLREI